MKQEIIFLKTFEISDNVFKEYCKSFNSIFKKKYDTIFFKKKYSGNYKGLSYHALLIEKNKVLAACTIMPTKYSIDGCKLNAGTLVDVFINSDKRKDPFLLLKLYKKIVDSLRPELIQILIAIPNLNAFNYWVKVVKFEKIGNLNYHVLPILSNKIGFLSSVVTFFFIKILPIIFLIFKKSISRSVNKIYCKKYKLNRFSEYHKFIQIDNEKVYYRIMNENNFKVAYIIYLGKNSQYNFNYAVDEISKIKNVDFIAFIGNLPFKQFKLFKVPNFLHPQRLPLCIKILDNKISDNLKIKIKKITNWNFSLYNFDVR